MGVDRFARWAGEDGSEPPTGQHSCGQGVEPYV